MAIASVQKTINADNLAAANPVNCVFVSTVGVGNLVYGSICYDAGGGSLTTVTDDKANSYTISENIVNTSNNQRLAQFYRENVTNAPKTISCNFSANASFHRAQIGEISGAATTTALNAHGGQQQNAQTAPSSGNITTTSNGCWIVAQTAATSGGTTIAAGSGYALENSGGGAAFLVPLASETQTQATAGTIAATFTYGTSRNAVTLIMAFRPAAVADVFFGQVWL